MKLGVVGLPNVGKSTLFNALTRAGAQSANYPFCTIEPNVGVVSVPDARLEVLGKMYCTQKITPATIEFVDIAGLVKGASTGEGLGNKFLSHIREVDAIIHAVRCFEDENVIHVDGKIDPARDIEVINLELILADLESLEKQIARAAKSARGGDKYAARELEILEIAKDHLAKGLPARTLQLDEDAREILKGAFLLSFKPVIYVANLDPEQLGNLMLDSGYQAVKDIAVKEHAQVIGLSARLEEELTALTPEEAEEYKSEFGIDELGLNKLIKACYELLGLISYLTAGEKEVRAWTVKKGTKAPQAAGVIHTDFERGFIKAEVISYEELVACGGFAQAKDAGKVRMEGKDYVVRDGDVILFRFNV